MGIIDVNSYSLQVRDESLVKSIVQVGAPTRAIGGSQRQSRRVTKRQWKGETIPMTAAEAEFVENFLLGRGYHWSFDTSLWSDYTGVGPEAGYTAVLWTSGSPKFGTSTTNNSLQLNPGATASSGVSYKVPWFTASNTYTLMFYMYSTAGGDSAAGWGIWNHFVVISNKGTIATYRNGSAYSSALLNNMAVSTSGNFNTYTWYGRAQDGTNSANVWLDDLVIVPYAMDATYAATTRYNDAGTTTTGTAATKAFSDLPKLRIVGDMLQESGPIEVTGEIGDVKYMQAVTGGSWANNMRSVAFTLTEV